MKRTVGISFVLIGLVALLVACGPSEADCEKLCDWAAEVCTDRESCMDDCLDAAVDDVDYALDNCLDRAVSTCKSANCCLRFTYTEYYWNQNCI